MNTSKDERKPPSLTSQSVWLISAKVVGFIISFALPLTVVRILEPNEFGLYRQAFVVVATAVSLLPLGMGMSAFFYLSREKEKRDLAITNILVFYLVVGSLVFAALLMFPSFLGAVFESDEIAGLSGLIGGVILVWLFSMFLEIAAVANREPKLSTTFIVFSQLSKAAFLLAAVVWVGTVRSLLIAALFQGLLQSVILILYLRSRFPGFWRRFDLSFFREHLAYALPFGFAGLFWVAQTDLHFFFVGNAFSTAEFAIYAIGCFHIPLISLLTESVASVLIPRMSELQATGDRREMLELFFRMVRKLALVYFPVYAYLLIVRETFITTLFTKEYAASVPIFLVFLTYIPFSIFNSDPIVRAFTSLGKWLLGIRIAITVILVFLLSWGVNNVGLVGMIAIVVSVQLFERILLVALSLRILKIRGSDIRVIYRLGAVILACFAGAVPAYFVYTFLQGNAWIQDSWLLSNLSSFLNRSVVELVTGTAQLGITLLIFALPYFLLIYRFDMIDPEDKQRLHSIASRIPFLKLRRLGSTE